MRALLLCLIPQSVLKQTNMKCFILAVMIGAVVCPNGHNHHGLSLDQVLALVAKDVDTDGNGEISTLEFQTELLNKWDNDGNGAVTCREFSHNWSTTYHDNEHTATQFCNNLDVSLPKGTLNEFDLLAHFMALDGINEDGVVTITDFNNFMHLMHPAGHGK